MSLDSVHIIIIAIAACVDVLLAYVWYHPHFLGNEWKKLQCLKDQTSREDQNAKDSRFPIQYILSFMTAYVLAHFVQYVGAVTLQEAVKLGFWIWIGFTGVFRLADLFRINGSMKLLYIDGGYRLLSLVVMSIILTLWG